MKLIQYEAGKLWGYKPLIWLLFLLVATNLLIFGSVGIQSLSITVGSSTYPLSVIAEDIEQYKALEREYYTGTNEEILARLEKDAESHTESFFLLLLLEEQRKIVHYPEYLASIQENADNMTSVSVFHDSTSFTYKNIVKTPKQYEHLKGLELKPGLGKGVVAATRFAFTDFLVLLSVILLCVYLFVMERERNLLVLVKSNKNGRLPTALAKLYVLFVGAAAVSLISYGSVLLMSHNSLPFGDLSRPLQSIGEFQKCSKMLTVGQFLILHLLVKTATVLLITAILGFVFLLFKNAVEAYLATGLLLVLCYTGYVAIPPASIINPLKYINPFSFLDTYRLFGWHTNLNLFGEPVNLRVIMTVLVPVVFLLFTVACALLFIHQSQISRTSPIAQLLDTLRIKCSRIRGNTSLFRQEAVKIVFHNRVWVILLCVCILAGWNVWTYKKPYMNEVDVLYRHYIEKYEGALTLENMAALEAEKELLDKEDSDSEMTRLKTEAFEKIWNQYQYLQNLRVQTGMDGQLVDATIYQRVFDREGKAVGDALLLCTLLVLCFGNVFAMEYKRGSVDVLRPTRNGQIYLVAAKCAVVLLCSALLYAVVYLPEIINIYRTYGFPLSGAPVQSLEAFSGLPVKMSIGMYMVASGVIRLLSVFSAAMLVLLFSSALKNFFIAAAAAGGVLLLPLLLQTLNFDFLRYFSFTGAFLLDSAFRAENAGSFAAVAVYVAITILSAAVFIFLLCRSFCNKPLRRQGV